ncbi:MAG: glycosyltransferase family 4 protein [Gemmatimonadales bacterium]
MRILLMVKQFDCGGAQNHVRELACALVRRGHRVWVAAPHGHQAALLDPAVVHVPVAYCDLLHHGLALRLAHLVRREGIDVLHAHQRLPTLTALLAGRLAGRPVIVTLHGQLQHDLTRWPATAQLLSRLIVVSPFFADLVARHEPALASKTVCIPNGVRRSALARAPDGHLVLYAGRLTPRHEPFLDALAGAAQDLAVEFPDLVLSIAGEGPSAPFLRARADAANHAASREVVCPCGFLPDLPDAFVAAALAIGVGRVALEAMMQGVPLLAANPRYLGSVVTQGNYAAMAAMNFVPQRCPAPTRAGIRRALASALARMDACEAEARALQPSVVRDYHLDAVAARVEGEYARLAHARRIARPAAGDLAPTALRAG